MSKFNKKYNNMFGKQQPLLSSFTAVKKIRCPVCETNKKIDLIKRHHHFYECRKCGALFNSATDNVYSIDGIYL